MHRIAAASLLALIPVLSLAAPAPPVYVDATALLDDDALVEAWYGGMVNLRVGFDDVCGDTFCEGDYTNLQPLRLRCSANEATRVVKRCQWTFAASNETINATTGQIKVDAPIFRCRIPVASGTTVAELARAWGGPDPLRAPIPRTGRSVYDALGDCL